MKKEPALLQTSCDSEVERNACMEYLHGLVIDDEFEAACDYEYARENPTIRKAAEQTAKPTPKLETAGSTISNPAGCWIWTQCLSFPALPWNEVPDAERELILSTYPSANAEPAVLPLTELRARRILDQLTSRAQKAARLMGMDDARPGSEPAMVQDGDPQIVHALFTLNFARVSKKEMMKQFESFLDRPENRVRFTNQRSDEEHKDLLKVLAVWRLAAWGGGEAGPESETGLQRLLDFTELHRRRGLSFHGAKQEQSRDLRTNQAPICTDVSFITSALNRARAHFTARFPPIDRRFATGGLFIRPETAADGR